jgi:hypothetical protein
VIALTSQTRIQSPAPAIGIRAAVSRVASVTNMPFEWLLQFSVLADEAWYVVSADGRLVVSSRRSSAACPDPLF